MNKTSFSTREQRCAQLVYAKVADILRLVKNNEWDDAKKKAYGSLAHKLPVLIRTAGLVQALAFVQARNKPKTPQHRLLCDLEEVLRSLGAMHAEQPQAESLVAHSRNAEFDEYLRLTEAALEALLWFKRFAQSELGVEAGDEPQEVSHAGA